MINELNIENFKGIKKADIPLGKITVLTGGNNSGKSSVLYALLTMKNILNNPNQNLDGCFTLPFIDHGGFDQSVFMRKENLNVGLGVKINGNAAYTMNLSRQSSSLSLFNFKAKVPRESKIEISFPYAGGKNKSIDVGEGGVSVKVIWNGLNAVSVNVDERFNEEITASLKKTLTEFFNSPLNTFESVDFVPVKRGFTKPNYSTIPLTSQITTEEQIATLLATDRELIEKVAFYLEKIVDRYFSVYNIPGTGSFYLQTRDKHTGFTAELVNEGTGTNQLVTILTKILQKKNRFICIDEPEVHLHPSIISKLVASFIDLCNNEERQFLISTHSEHFVNALLSHVAEGKLKPEDLNIYYLHKDKGETKIELQKVNERGQIEGGLKHFYEAELSDLSKFFKITD